MTLLVVDDEYYIVQGIIDGLERKDLGIGEIHRAYSMDQALKILESHSVDILLSDIEMPRGSGLDLVNRCREKGYDPVTLFLTGHQNFDYIRQAIGLRCLDYLLKPIDPELLNRHLKKAAEEVKRKREGEKRADHADHWLSNQRNRTVSFWMRLLAEEIGSDRREIGWYLEEQQLPVDRMEEEFFLCLFNITGPSPGEMGETGVSGILKEQLSESRHPSFREPVLKLSESEYALPAVFTPSREYGRFCGELEKMLPGISEQLSCQISVYVADKSPLEILPSRMRELRKAANRVKAVGSRVVPVEIFKSGEYPSANNYVDIPMGKWSEWLLQYRPELIQEDLDRILKEEFKYYSSTKLVSLYHGVIRLIYSCFSYRNIEEKHMAPQIASYENLNWAIHSMDDFLSWAEKILNKSVSLLRSESDSGSLVRKVRTIVQTRLDQEGLDRTFIAGEINMNPDYLSHLFHKQSGQSLVSFINGERIDAAKKLLLTTDMTMSLIAEKVGYFNTPYFYRQFKRNTGITPKQFRESAEE